MDEWELTCGCLAGRIGLMARTYAEAVRSLMSKSGMTVAALASASGLEPSLISSIERGKLDEPTFSTIIDLAKGLGIPTVTLVEEGLGGVGCTVRKLSIKDLSKRIDLLMPEQEELIRSAFENDQQELLIELHEDLETWAAVEVALTLASLKPDEISCVAPGLIYLWWDKSLAHLPAT
jgi:transcriptional regulator with XRE-family HTH domain